MRKKLSANCKRISIIAILIIALMLLTSVSVLAEGGEYAGKLVILHTNDFVSNGGEAYFALGSATDKVNTGIPFDTVVTEYVKEKLGGYIGMEYANPKGRITILTDKAVPTPDTADNFPLIISISVMGASVLLGTACAVKSKRKAK